MKEKKLTMSFNISGEFVTRTAREWFFYENKPYETVEELLFSCMCGTDLPTEELKRMAQEIILGRSEFKGWSGDNTFEYVKLENSAELNIFTEYSKLAQKNKELNKDLKTLNDRFLNLCGAINDITYGYSEEAIQQIENNNDKKRLVDMLRAVGDCKISYSPMTGYSILDDYLEASKTDNNYGWLSPNGEFHPVDWCEHQEWAELQVEKMGLCDEFEKWNDTESHSMQLWGDFLCEKGWILLHNPARGTAKVTRNESKRITKAQSEFLFNYYTDRGKHDLAKEYLI